MKKMLLSMFAMAAFAVTFAGTMMSGSLDADQRWMYVGETIPLAPNELPDCRDGAPLCAQLHELNETSGQWEPVEGDPDDSSIYRYGFKTN